jgi:seryl-tRNA synthetase
MHNIKVIRENPGAFDNAMIRRGLGPMSNQILEMDKQVREEKTVLQELQQQANDWAKQIGLLKAKGEDASEAIAKSKELKEQVACLKQKMESIASDSTNELVEGLLATLPNIPHDDVPNGESEDDNVEIRRWGDKREFSFPAKEHFELGKDLGMMDFKTAAKMSGSRFVILKGQLAKLERALGQFMLDIHTKEFGYTETSVPMLVRDEAMFGSGQLPKFAEDSFKTTNDYRLIPTAEVSLVNTVRESILAPEQLPMRLVSLTPCFRSEAGSAGKDTTGMIRMHQFWKVELVSITDEISSEKEHERMTSCAEEIIRRLKIPYRVILLCTGDMGFTASKTYDFELWMPGQLKYREVSSCSNCGDFQAIRMNSRYKKNDKENVFVHTLNGSGLAVGRTMVAIMENYQNADGSINIPEALQSYMGADIIKV